MKLARPRLFSHAWWRMMAAATLLIAAVTLLVLTVLGDFDWEQVLLYLLVITLAGDLITALSMEAIVPTRVAIGPGDRRLDEDAPQERGVVVASADAAGIWRVRIRGETWQARMACDAGETPALGSRVRVVDRQGLTLVVTPAES